MVREHDRKLILEDGSVYTGIGFGADCERVCELVFDTAMVGYQDILTDSTFTNQIVVMTYPLIGNYGIVDDDLERRTPSLGGLVVRDYNDQPSNFRYTRTLSETMEEDNIPGISDIDTRALTRRIRDKGVCKALITDIDTSMEEAMEKLAAPLPSGSVAKVSCKKRWYAKTSNPKHNIAVIDCGVKSGFIRNLNKFSCNVTVMPYNTTAEMIEEIHPDALLISNGPGAAEELPEIVELIKQLRGRYPMLGIGLGHELICLAYGAKLFKMHFGHHGGNHAVRNLDTNKLEIVSQNHNYAVDADSIKNTDLRITHVNVLDDTVEGVYGAQDAIMGLQFYPDCAPGGTEDSAYLYPQFIKMMEDWKNAKKN